MSRIVVLLILASILVSAPAPLYAQGYGGPSLLSRGGNRPGQRGRAPVNFKVYGAVRGSYETGLIGVALDEAGDLTSATVRGVQVEAGAYGARSWRRSSLGLDYRGDYRRTGLRRFDGTNQAMSLDWQAEPTRRISYYLQQTAGTTNRAFGGFSAPAFADQDNFGVPLNEVFDSRVYFGQTSAGLTYRQSARSSILFTGEGFIVKRSNRALIGMQGYRAGTEWRRQVSRATMVGAGYNYLRFTYPRIYGGSEIHMVYGALQRRVSRNLEIAAQLGVFRAQTTGTQTITLSPEIAAILGRTSGVEAFHRIFTAPQAMVTMNYILEHSRLTFTYNSGVNPGNGVYITSRMDSFRGGISYSGLRRLSLGASAGYTRTKSIGLTLGDFSNAQGGGGFTYKLSRFFSLSLQADRRKFTAPTVPGRSGTAIAAGLSFDPGEMPLSIW